MKTSRSTACEAMRVPKSPLGTATSAALVDESSYLSGSSSGSSTRCASLVRTARCSDVERKIERLGQRRCFSDERRDVGDQCDDRECRRGGAGGLDRDRQIVERSQHQLAQHHERGLAKDPVSGAVDSLVRDDLPGPKARVQYLRRYVDPDHLIRRLEKRERDELSDGKADDLFGV